MAGELLDALSAAGIAQAAVARSLAAQRGAEGSAVAAAASADAAAASRIAITALLAGLGLPVRWVNDTALQIRLPDGSWTAPVDLGSKVPGPTGAVPDIQVGTVLEGEFAVSRALGSPDEAPVFDFVLERGLSAWTPIPAAVADGARRVLQIVDWTGGQGTKPATGLYVGAAGLVPDLASAVDLLGNLASEMPALLAAAWATLPTSPPATPGLPWRNGDTLSFS